MQTSVEVFLEQIIDNVAFFECNQEDKIAEDKNNYTVLKFIVSKEKINTLKIGYYYELRLSKSMTPIRYMKIIMMNGIFISILMMCNI